MMTTAYMKFPKKNCPNVSRPCWIPQADSIIHDHIIHSLPQCDTIEKYGCMLDTLRNAPYEYVDQQCMKSCKAETYKISSSEGAADPFTLVSENYNCQLSFLLAHNFQKGKTWSIYVVPEYQSFTESLRIETEVYNFNAIAASVGGSLGLFLGFSFYEYGKRLIDSLSTDWFEFRMILTKTSTNTEVTEYLEENTDSVV